MALMTRPWKDLGTPRWFICATRLTCNCEYTSEPSTATPVTAPISRLVLLADAAMPDRSAGTADSTEEVIGTTVVPMPMPATASATVSSAKSGFGDRTLSVQNRPAASSTQPIVIDQRGPAVSVQRPASTDATIISTVIGRKMSASR